MYLVSNPAALPRLVIKLSRFLPRMGRVSRDPMPVQTIHTHAAKPMEHRWGERVALDCPAQLVLRDGTLIEGDVRDASISGALIETAQRIPMYTTLSVHLPAADGSGRRTLELPACVVRTARDGVAVEWRDMAAPTLVALLREAAGNAVPLCARDRAFG